MIEGAHPLFQTVLGTLFTWGLTALGAGLVFVFNNGQRKILDGSLGFAAGVMTAASYWSLLAPAIEMAESSGMYGETGQWSFAPVSIGFILGALFVYGADQLMPHCGNLLNPAGNLAAKMEVPSKRDEDVVLMVHEESRINSKSKHNINDAARLRRPQSEINGVYDRNSISSNSDRVEPICANKSINWRRILLLIIAITIHNIPEGLAVGVGFGAVGKTKSATFESARNLAFGIGIQNFPEGLAVSLPLRGSGMSTFKSFWYGQLSGMVEPIAGILGALAVAVAEPILPYALAFAAGAMIYVVMDDIIPEAQVCGNGKLASMGAIFGFVVMMSLDVGLG